MKHCIDYGYFIPIKLVDERGRVTEYQYDALGRRIAKTLRAGRTDEETVQYFHHGWQVIEERDGASGDPLAWYVYGSYIDEPLAMVVPGDNPSATEWPIDAIYYYHQDDLYNVVALTDESGAVVERHEYLDYGQQIDPAAGDAAPWRPLDPAATGQLKTYTGREYEPESGYYYFRTRYMEPDAGRFTTRDTIGIWGDGGNVGNGYGYVGNQPLRFIDPYGEQKYTAIWEPFKIKEKDPPFEVRLAFNELRRLAWDQEDQMHHFWDTSNYRYDHSPGSFEEQPNGATIYRGQCVWLAENLLSEMRIELNRLTDFERKAPIMVDPRTVYKFRRSRRGAFRDHWAVIIVRPITVSIETECRDGSWKVIRHEPSDIPKANVRFPRNGHARIIAEKHQWTVSDPTGGYHGILIGTWLSQIYPDWGHPGAPGFGWLIGKQPDQ